MEPILMAGGLAWLAGLLSILSPCVLPLLPILVSSAVLTHRYGALVLSAGLAASFTLAGVGLATIGVALGLGQESFRDVASLVLLGLGGVLVSPRLQEAFSVAVSRLTSTGQTALASFNLRGLSGQFVLGFLLGLVWSPCVGPTLGAAVILAGQGENLFQVTLVMASFGLGACVPLVGLGLASRQVMARWQGRLLATGTQGKKALGVLLLLMAVMVLTGADKRFEAWVLEHMPEFLVRLTTYF